MLCVSSENKRPAHQGEDQQVRFGGSYKNGLSSLMSVTSDTQINENLKHFSEKRRSLISERETTHDSFYIRIMCPH
jgi:hypothetical protein